MGTTITEAGFTFTNIQDSQVNSGRGRLSLTPPHEGETFSEEEFMGMLF